VQSEFRSTLPIPNADHHAALEKRKQRAVSTNVAVHSRDSMLKFSDFRTLTRVVAYIRRFQSKREEVTETKVISNEEFQNLQNRLNFFRKLLTRKISTICSAEIDGRSKIPP